MSPELQRELATIQAQHEFNRRQSDHIKYLEIALREARGQFVGFRDKGIKKEILERYPDMER